jgi:hypothetical protein
MDDSEEPEVKEAAFEELVAELSDLHGLSLGVWESLQPLQNEELEGL